MASSLGGSCSSLGQARGLPSVARRAGFLIPLHPRASSRWATSDRRGGAVDGGGARLRTGCGALSLQCRELWDMCGSRGPIEVLSACQVGQPVGIGGVRLHQTRRLHAYEVTSREQGSPWFFDRAGAARHCGAYRCEAAGAGACRSGLSKRTCCDWRGLSVTITSQARREGHRSSEADRDWKSTPGAGDTKSVLGDRLPGAMASSSSIAHDLSLNVLVEGHLVDFLWPAQKVVVETDS